MKANSEGGKLHRQEFMAIPILEQRKKLKRLIPVFAMVSLATALVLWLGFFSKPKNSPPLESSPQNVARKIEIDWSVLKNPALDNFDLFEEIPPLQGKAGRDNPFEQY
ncbi:MAG: hypothetical protein Q7S60_05925 [bacterium]|nr:hypothetical protein [bacterium]